MLRPTLALAAVCLFTAVALSIALVAVSDTSEADNDVHKQSVSETRSNAGPLVGYSHGTANSTPADSLGRHRNGQAPATGSFLTSRRLWQLAPGYRRNGGCGSADDRPLQHLRGDGGTEDRGRRLEEIEHL